MAKATGRHTFIKDGHNRFAYGSSGTIKNAAEAADIMQEAIKAGNDEAIINGFDTASDPSTIECIDAFNGNPGINGIGANIKHSADEFITATNHGMGINSTGADIGQSADEFIEERSDEAKFGGKASSEPGSSWSGSPIT